MYNDLSYRPNSMSLLASTLNVLAGIWLFFSPWLLGFGALPTPMWNTLLVGAGVVILAAIRLGTPESSELSWLNVILGVWLIISPFVLGFNAASTATTNAIIFGIVVGILGLWAALTPTNRVGSLS